MKKLVVILLVISKTLVFSQQNWYIDTGSDNGAGTIGEPFNSFSTALSNVEAGDTLWIMPGLYDISEYLSPQNSGTSESWITLKAYDPEDVPELRSSNARILLLDNDHYYRFENIVFNGNFMPEQICIIRNNTSNITFSSCVFKQSGRDGISIDTGRDFIFEGCEIFYCVRMEDGAQKDAHGIMIRHARNTRINNCDIHHNTGDCIQIGTPESPPVWDTVYVTNTVLHTGPVDTVVNGVPANTYLGENAFDTKTIDNSYMVGDLADYRGYCYLENVTAHGFNRAINYSTFAIKRTVDVTLKNCVAYDCYIAYRFRGNDTEGNPDRTFTGSHGKMINCVGYDNRITLWPEADVESLEIVNCTFDKEDGNDYFDSRTSYNEDGFVIKNTIFVGEIEDDAGDDPTIYSAESSDFLGYAFNDYKLAETSGAIGYGEDTPLAVTDIEGNERASGEYDAGAYQYHPVSGICDTTYITISGTVTDEDGTDGDGAINITVAGGEMPLSYIWSNSATTEDVTNLHNGSYSISVIDANGCRKTETFTVNQTGVVDPCASTVIAVTANIYSEVDAEGNGAIDLNVSGGTIPRVYVWSNTDITQDIDGLHAGTYSVVITDANGCSTSGSYTVGQISSTEPDSCESVNMIVSSSIINETDSQGNGAIELSISGGAKPRNYVWSNSENTQDIYDLEAGTYIVSITDANGCPASGPYTFNVSNIVSNSCDTTDILIEAVISNEINYEQNGAIEIAVKGGADPCLYEWSNTQTTEDITDLQEGTYSVTVTDGNGCYATKSFVVDVVVFSGVNDHQMEDIKMWPVPAKNNLSLANVTSYIHYTIYNLHGEAVNQGAINSDEIHLNISELNNGIYIIKLLSDNNKYNVLRFVKE